MQKNQTNPYNCTIPGKAFVGYQKLREDLAEGFRNGKSFALIGGRRCGKTSLLLRLEEELSESFIPRYLSIQSLGARTPDALFRYLYESVSREIQAPDWKKDDDGQDYRNFEKHLHALETKLTEKYGRRRIFVFLIDELDAALQDLPDDKFFQNLRHFLMVSPFRSQFRLIASGVRDLAGLISSSSSPLNNLEHCYLSRLSEEAAKELVSFGFPQPSSDFYEKLFVLTGRHPYLMQGVLEKLHQQEDPPFEDSIWREAVSSFLESHTDFPKWRETFGEDGNRLYQELALSPEGKIGLESGNYRDETALILSYHGIIDDSNPKETAIAGTLFRDWFLKHDDKIKPVKTTKLPGPPPLQPKIIREYHIFLSSPGDRGEERKMVRDFFIEYNQTTGQESGNRFVVIDWENYTSIGLGRPQELITEQTLEKYKNSLALVIGILGQRFGTPTGTHESGTEEEFEWALDCAIQTGWPEIKWFFLRIEQFVASSANPEDIESELDQWKKVNSFKLRLQQGKPQSGQPPLWYKEYDNSQQFQEILRKDVNLWLNDPKRPWREPLLVDLHVLFPEKAAPLAPP